MQTKVIVWEHPFCTYNSQQKRSTLQNDRIPKIFNLSIQLVKMITKISQRILHKVYMLQAQKSLTQFTYFASAIGSGEELAACLVRKVSEQDSRTDKTFPLQKIIASCTDTHKVIKCIPFLNQFCGFFARSQHSDVLKYSDNIIVNCKPEREY